MLCFFWRLLRIKCLYCNFVEMTKRWSKTFCMIDTVGLLFAIKPSRQYVTLKLKYQWVIKAQPFKTDRHNGVKKTENSKKNYIITT